MDKKLDGRKHFRGGAQSQGAALGNMLNDDLIKSLRLKSMKRISHFVWLRKQFYQVRNLECAEISFFLFSFHCLASVGMLPGKMKGIVDDSSLSGERTMQGIDTLTAESGKTLKS